MLDTTEYEICPADKFQITNKCKFILLSIAEHENFSANKYENANYQMWAFSYLLAEKISCSAELSMKKVL